MQYSEFIAQNRRSGIIKKLLVQAQAIFFAENLA